VYNKRIADFVATYYKKTPGVDLAAVTQVMQAEVTAHEFTHHFRTNPPPAVDWHCAGADKVMEDRADKFCIQNTSEINRNNDTLKQKWDGIVGWHKSTAASEGEAETTRKAAEPVPQGIESEYFAFQKF
jgi:hypothetical protein